MFPVTRRSRVPGTRARGCRVVFAVLIGVLGTVGPSPVSAAETPGRESRESVADTDNPTGPAVSLEEAYVAALKQSETVATQTELLRQVEERYRQSVGSILPSVSAIGSFTTQDSNASLGYATSAQQSTVRINAAQPLFRGFREFAGLRYAGRLVRAQTEARRQAELLLFLDVAQNFYALRSLETDLTNLNSEIALYERRITDLRERMRIGRSRQTEVLTTESAMLALRSQARAVRGQIRAAREVFAFLTGLPATRILKENPLNPATSRPADAYLGRIEARPDIRTELERVAAAEEGVSIATGAHWPSVDLNGNWYLLRNGTANNAAWDLQLLATLPLYAGGVLQSKVREAQSVRAQEDLALARARRAAREEVASLHATLEADIAQVAELARAAEVSERNYVETTRDYRLGLNNNLDVLQALTAYQESHRSLDRARYSARMDRTRLEAAIGELWGAAPGS